MHRIDQADGVQSVAEGFDKKPPAEEDGLLGAFALDVGHWDAQPRLVVAVLAKEQELTVSPFKTDGLVSVRIVARNALDQLDERFQL